MRYIERERGERKKCFKKKEESNSKKVLKMSRLFN
jgi:hypothetical protein